jgi:hypothetical protein
VDLSKTFKRVCMQDFDGADEDEWAPDGLQIDAKCCMPMSIQVFQLQMLRIATAFEEEYYAFLRYNMVSVAAVFNEFLAEIFDPEEDAEAARLMNRTDLPTQEPCYLQGLLNMTLADTVLGSLDYDDDRYSHLGEAFEKFFHDLDLDRVRMKTS